MPMICSESESESVMPKSSEPSSTHSGRPRPSMAITIAM